MSQSRTAATGTASSEQKWGLILVPTRNVWQAIGRMRAFVASLSMLPVVASGQLLFTSGTDSNQLLFERINGQTVQVNTG
jgi:hypothetical protein